MKRTLVDVIRGKRSKYEIYRNELAFGFDFSIYRDGELWKAGIKNLSYAADEAKEGG